MALTEADVLFALRDVFDPEFPVNIVDLGLVYRITIALDPDAPGMIPKHLVEVDMTLTSRDCPMHGMILGNVQNRLACIQEVGATKVNLVWEPAWSSRRISATARKQLGMS